MFTGTDLATAISVPLYYGIVEAVMLAVFCIVCWKIGWTKAPKDENICRMLVNTYEEIDDEDESNQVPAIEVVQGNGEQKSSNFASLQRGSTRHNEKRGSDEMTASSELSVDERPASAPPDVLEEPSGVADETQMPRPTEGEEDKPEGIFSKIVSQVKARKEGYGRAPNPIPRYDRDGFPIVKDESKIRVRQVPTYESSYVSPDKDQEPIQDKSID
jgi:hypothetical protein